MSDLGFPRQARLIEADEFSSVFNFRKRISGQYLIVYYRFNQVARPRLGLIASKKVARAAVQRNYMRRVLRELFRKQQSQLGAVDLVIRIQKRFGRQQYYLVTEEFLALSEKLAQIQARASING
ncbi:MAG TPA: ribonuclease P protein component [Methylophilaceae bacterium]|nr:ribonuclease P protein component [Methylophilaceae bacterium]